MQRNTIPENVRKKLRRKKPEVDEAREFLEITNDFNDPKEAIREAISNSIDWGANNITITVKEDRTRSEEELVLEIEDDGIGLDEERLRAFFNLGTSTSSEDVVKINGIEKRIGYKGHGTKTYFNSRMVEVYSRSRNCILYAIMDNPLQKLMDGKVPEYKYNIERKSNDSTWTKITIYGYNRNRNKEDFRLDVLKDYILWFTCFGSVEKEFGIKKNKDKKLLLKAFGSEDYEPIPYGHVFAPHNSNIEKLVKSNPGDWTKLYVKRMYCKSAQVINFSNTSISIVFYIEGDEAKRKYNEMIRPRTGGGSHYGKYKVEDRYGLWACKDYIPIKRVNEWLGLGKRLETKYHAFVNCQDFRLTANRGDIGNTPPDLLNSIASTVNQVFEEEIIGSDDYQEYDEAAQLEKPYQTAVQEGKDFTRRKKRARENRIYKLDKIELIEPSLEMGVIALFNLIYAKEPSVFPFHVVDYDSKRGYDALVSQNLSHDLNRESMYFIEFKYYLQSDFNHSFDHLIAIICWDCELSNGSEVRDLKNNRRELAITPKGELNYTRYMLSTRQEFNNIEVFVLKQYLKEKLNIEFKPRSS